MVIQNMSRLCYFDILMYFTTLVSSFCIVLIYFCNCFDLFFCIVFFFFFQAEDGIRDWSVTGVQTCALPICARHDDQDHAGRRHGGLDLHDAVLHDLDRRGAHAPLGVLAALLQEARDLLLPQIGRASCRERVSISVLAVSVKKNSTEERYR